MAQNGKPPLPPPRAGQPIGRRPLPVLPPEDNTTGQESLLRDGEFKARSTAQTDSTYMTLLTDMDALQFVEMVHVVRAFDGIYSSHYDMFDAQLLSVQRGDIMLVLERMDENFLRAKRFSDGETGIVHRNNVFVDNGVESMGWFHGPLAASDASALLKNPGVVDGAFLLRNSSTDASSYSLSIRYSGCDNGILHYKIKKHPEGFSLFSGKTFTYLFQLVAYYQYPDSVHTCSLKQHLTVPLDRLGPLPLRKIAAGEIDFGGPVVDKKDNVITGKWKKTELAIKTWQPTRGSIPDFEEFGKMLLEIQHLNVIKLLGICEYPPNTYIVYEYVSKGSLENMLKTTDFSKVEPKPLMKIAQGISNGMAFLESKGIIHRNLKASNVVINDLTMDNRSVRIIGFTKAQRANQNGQCAYDGCTLAVRWAAPEIIAKIIGGSHMTDVWAFAIVMAELFTGGLRPYNGMGDNAAVKDALQNDYRMDRPERLDENVWRTVVYPAWNKNPIRRPPFSRIQEFFEEYLGQEDESDYDQLVKIYTM